MPRSDQLPGHTMDAYGVRNDPDPRKLPLAKRRIGTGMKCSCGWIGPGSGEPPTYGGLAEVIKQHRRHIADVISRSPQYTATHCLNEWRDWNHNGTCYRVRIVAVGGGPDHTDNILLVSVGRRCWALQYATVAYRIRENGPWTAEHARSCGIPSEIWRAARPLLVAVGVAREVVNA